MHNITTKPTRTTNRGARAYVRSLTPFHNSNKQLYGKWINQRFYVVYSYGPHWPLFAYDSATSTWYENEDRYSMTTTHHRSYANPFANTETRSCAWLRNFLASERTTTSLAA